MLRDQSEKKADAGHFAVVQDQQSVVVESNANDKRESDVAMKDETQIAEANGKLTLQ